MLWVCQCNQNRHVHLFYGIFHYPLIKSLLLLFRIFHITCNQWNVFLHTRILIWSLVVFMFRFDFLRRCSFWVFRKHFQLLLRSKLHSWHLLHLYFLITCELFFIRRFKLRQILLFHKAKLLATGSRNHSLLIQSYNLLNH